MLQSALDSSLSIYIYIYIYIGDITYKLINQFYKLSGLKINLSKTQIVWIGSKKYSSEKPLNEMNFQWTTQFKVLGIYFDVDLSKVPKLNYDKKLVKIKNIILQWSKRRTTPLGRISLIKSLLIAQLNHLFIALPSPSENFVKNLNSVLFNFLWGSKVDKIKRKQITQDYKSGGLNMIDLNNYIKSLKSSWIKKLLNGQESKWRSLVQKAFNIKKLFNTGSNYIEIILQSITNDFWKDTLFAFKNIEDKMKIESWEDFISQPLWYNKKLKIDNKPIFYSKWFINGVVLISDLLDEKGSFLELKDLKAKFNIETNF